MHSISVSADGAGWALSTTAASCSPTYIDDVALQIDSFAYT